jgi:hypothetical protein
VCFALILGSEQVLQSSADPPLEVMTYSLPVPVFGDASAVEGVLTAARHSAAGDLGGKSRPESTQLRFCVTAPDTLQGSVSFLLWANASCCVCNNQ